MFWKHTALCKDCSSYFSSFVLTYVHPSLCLYWKMFRLSQNFLCMKSSYTMVTCLQREFNLSCFVFFRLYLFPVWLFLCTFSYLDLSLQHLLLGCGPFLWFLFKNNNTLASKDMSCFAPLCELLQSALKVSGWLWNSFGSPLKKSDKEYKQGSHVSGLCWVLWGWWHTCSLWPFQSPASQTFCLRLAWLAHGKTTPFSWVGKESGNPCPCSNNLLVHWQVEQGFSLPELSRPFYSHRSSTRVLVILVIS